LRATTIGASGKCSTASVISRQAKNPRDPSGARLLLTTLILEFSINLLFTIVGAKHSKSSKVAKSKMPRGSKPGERRGGRQRGTPNKSTLLKNAAFKAAAIDPNLSPLDFLLTLMRQGDLPLELRVAVAHQALPLAHRKPKPSKGTMGAPGRSSTKRSAPG
jgi:hypothetical protein